MNSIIRIDDFGPLSFKNGIPAHLAIHSLPSSQALHAVGPWGTICMQELKTDRFLLRHFLFILQKTIAFYTQEHNEGLQSLLSIQGNIYHSVNSLKTISLQEKEFILFDALKEETFTKIEGPKTTSLLNVYYKDDTYKALLPLFPSFKKEIKKTRHKATYFTASPLLARFTVHDAVMALWFDKYNDHLRQKHIDLRLESTLFTLLAQTYSDGNTNPPSPYETEKAEAARQIILKDIRQHLTPEEIAAQLNCSAGWLKKAFGKVFGIGMFQLLRRTRMEHAKEMLLKGDSLKAVAIEVGMKPRNFPKEFKSYFGYTVTSLKKGQHH
jgi:AraC-like DNA-binding protein